MMQTKVDRPEPYWHTLLFLVSSRADHSAVVGMMDVVTWPNPRVKKDAPKAWMSANLLHRDSSLDEMTAWRTRYAMMTDLDFCLAAVASLILVDIQKA